jgi:flagellar protein FlgJ
VIAPVASTRAAPVADPALKKAAQGFEAVFLRQVIGSMRQAKLGEDLFGSSATDTYRELSDKQMADNLASTGSLGIAALVEAQLSRKGEVR